MIHFTKSPIDTIPDTFPPSNTGMCRIRCSVISFMQCATVSPGVTDTGSADMISLTGVFIVSYLK